MVKKIIGPDNSVRYRIDVRTTAGRRVRTLFDTKAEAVEHLKGVQRAKTLRKLGVAPAASTAEHSIEDCIRKYIRDVTSAKFSPLASCTDKATLGKLFDFLVNDQRIEMLGEVQSVMMHDFQRRLASEEVAPGVKISPSTVNRQMNTVKHFFSMCRSWEYIPENPCWSVKRLREITPPRRLWTKWEQQTLFAMGDTTLRPFYRALGETGARPVEMVKLTWARIDFERMQITLHSWKNRSTGYHSIPMTEECAEIFRELRAARPPASMDAPVFIREGRFGRVPLTGNFVDKRFAKDRIRLGLSKELKLYALRHTYATGLTAADVPTTVVSKLLGHSQISTTMRYSQADMEMMKRALARLNAG